MAGWGWAVSCSHGVEAGGCSGELWLRDGGGGEGGVAAEDVEAGGGPGDVAAVFFVLVGDAVALAGGGRTGGQLCVGAARGEGGGVAEGAGEGFVVAVGGHDPVFGGDGRW